MNVEIGQSQIPEYLRPLYEARTAGQSIREAVKLLVSVKGQEQRKIIEEPAFGAIVRSALEDSDENRQVREKKLFESVKEEKSFQSLDEAIYPSNS